MVYNLTNVSSMVNNSGVLGMTQEVNNQLMFGWLGALFLIAVSFIILTSFLYSTNDVKRSVAATSFISFGIALFLRAISMLPDLGIYITLVVAGVALAFSWKRS